MGKGSLCLVLHCHLPYVRHPEHDDFLEEDWLYEAVAETYVPLLHVLEGLAADRVPFRIALSFSPTLCEMLSNELLQRRCVRYLERHVELAEKEAARNRHTPFHEAARMYEAAYSRACRTYVERLQCDLLGAYAALADQGGVELLASSATHALLPLMATPECRRAQVAVGLRNFQKHFGRRPVGFWLPECAYEPGIDRLLADFGVRFFLVDTHAVLLAEPRPPLGVFAPVRTPGGPYAFGRDVESSRQVWSATEGYPGDAEYREFHRDLGFDAPLEHVRPYLHADGVRRHLGLKYHRVTGDVPLDAKLPYRPAAAAERAAVHARHFVAQRADQVRRVRRATGRDPLLVSPYDAELFGHWWLEGPQFLDHVLRLVAQRPGLECVTPSGWLDGAQPPAEQAASPICSTWGNGGHFEVWLNRANDWTYPELHRAEATMVELAARGRSADPLLRRALNQCARELMLAQSSDWAFLMHTGAARAYAARRFRDLMGRFRDLAGRLRAGAVDPEALERCEWLDDPFPEMDYRAFLGGRAARGP